ncbi:MAG: hypothetical protein ABEI39_01570 [Halobacteriales archaeon]
MGANTERIESIRQSKRQNRIAVGAGAGVTLAASLFFFFLPALIPMEQFRMLVWEATGKWVFENPFQQLRILGPGIGGLIAGYFSIDRTGSRDWTMSMKNGIYAALIGVGLIYLVYSGFIAVRYGTAIVTDPAISLNVGHVLDILMVPLVFVFPLLPAAIFEGFIFGAAGNGLRLVIPVGSAAGS